MRVALGIDQLGGDTHLLVRSLDAPFEDVTHAELADRNKDDLLVLQTEITNRIANALGVELVNREPRAA